MSLRDRHRGRRAALQILYQWEVGRLAPEEAIASYATLDEAERSPGSLEFAAALVRGTVAHLASIDPLLSGQAEHWRLSRMASLDRLILRLAVYELLYEPGTPAKVVINEALELARAFSTEDAVRFINGVLDGIRRRLETGPAGPAGGAGPPPASDA